MKKRRVEVGVTPKSYGLVQRLANKFAYSGRSIEFEMLVNVGLEALIGAVETYNKEKNVDFLTYATVCVRNKMCTFKDKLEKCPLVEMDSHPVSDMKDKTHCSREAEMIALIREAIDKFSTSKRERGMTLRRVGTIKRNGVNYKKIAHRYKCSSETARMACKSVGERIKANEEYREAIYACAR